MSAGYRSLTGSWVGGLSVSPVVVNGGYRSHFGFWFGGLCAPQTTPPEPEPDTFLIHGAYYFDHKKRKKKKKLSTVREDIEAAERELLGITDQIEAVHETRAEPRLTTAEPLVSTAPLLAKVEYLQKELRKLEALYRHIKAEEEAEQEDEELILSALPFMGF
jgi:hypothetical protein